MHSNSWRSMRLDQAATGVASNAFGFVITLAIQGASVPFYLRAFGLNRYGEWLVISAIPMYLSLSDLGFAAVSSTQATREFATGNASEARITMRSAWLVVSTGSLAILATLALLVWSLPVEWLHINEIPRHDAQLILLLLVAYTLMTVQSSLVEGCFRAGRRFPVGISIATALRLFEFVVAALTALGTHSPVITAGSLLGARILGQVAYLYQLRRLVPELMLGFQDAQYSTFRCLVLPGLGFLSFPLGNTVAMQGMIMVTATELGPAAVVVLNAVRIMGNMLRQIASTVYNGVLPEVTAALARGDHERARRLVNGGLAVTLVIAALCGATLVVAKNQILGVWTGGSVQAPALLVLAMAATVLVDLPWLAWSLLLIARNRHAVLGALYAGSCLLSVVAAKLLLPRLGLLAIPLTLLLVDVVLYVPAYRGAVRVLTLPSLSRTEISGVGM